ncbi:MAG: hypothetical protein MJ174_01375 [Treponema sp.]|nr:hypothetical protein [Treponema sp.]
MIKFSLRKHVIAIFAFTTIFSISNITAESFLTGNVGACLDYTAEKNLSNEYDPNVNLNAYFEGQFNFSENFWGHLGMSISTDNFVASGLFQEIPSFFEIDELSLVYRSTYQNFSNYFGAFLGYFDPFGSDIFLQRYLGSTAISSKISTSWLGRDATPYPQYGIGISDVAKLNAAPIAIGTYFYFNDREPTYSYFLNADLRIAGLYRYCTFDTSFGVGFLKSGSGTSILSIDKVTLHGGATILIGNKYTQSLFLHTGIYNLIAETGSPITFTSDDFYFFVEPRFVFNYLNLNTCFYYMPDDNTKDAMDFVYQNLGANIDIYTDSLAIGDKNCTIGFLTSIAFPGKKIDDLFTSFTTFIQSTDDVDLYLTPYFSTTFLSGTFSTQLDVNLMGFFRPSTEWYEHIGFKAGYTIQF